jgi:hypothetical protein
MTDPIVAFGFSLALAALAAPAENASQPAIAWITDYEEARCTAAKQGKPILLEEYRDTCGNCSRLQTSVLSLPDVVALVNRRFGPLRAHTDRLPPDLENLLRKIHGAGKKYELPFLAYLTPEGEVVHSTYGFRAPRAFRQDLETVLAGDAFRMSPDVGNRIARLAESAAKSFEARRFAAVIRAAAEAGAERGWSESKEKLAALLEKCESEGSRALDQAAQHAVRGRFDDAEAAARKVREEFAGTTLEREAERAISILDRMRRAERYAEEGEITAARTLLDSIASASDEQRWAGAARERLAKLVSK